jgi:hypothetical protein
MTNNLTEWAFMRLLVTVKLRQRQVKRRVQSYFRPSATKILKPRATKSGKREKTLHIKKKLGGLLAPLS